MAITFLVCLLVAVASAAPHGSSTVTRDWQQELVDNLEFNRLQDIYRQIRSNYGNLYMTPCAAAAASAPVQAYSPIAANTYTSQHIPAYGNPSASATPTAVYSHGAYNIVSAQKGNPSSYPYNYGRPYYRSADQFEDDQEGLAISDSDQGMFEHTPTARYEAVGGGIVRVNQAASSSGPMVGVFPTANAGGYNVPVLVSCTPSIAQGRLVKTQPYYDSSSPTAASSQSNLYRGVTDHSLEDGHHETAGFSSKHNTSQHEVNPINHKH